MPYYLYQELTVQHSRVRVLKNKIVLYEYSVLEYIIQGLVGDKELGPIAYRLPVGAKHKFLSTYCLPVGDRC
jgi:hypothetical protein